MLWKQQRDKKNGFVKHQLMNSTEHLAILTGWIFRHLQLSRKTAVPDIPFICQQWIENEENSLFASLTILFLHQHLRCFFASRSFTPRCLCKHGYRIINTWKRWVSLTKRTESTVIIEIKSIFPNAKPSFPISAQNGHSKLFILIQHKPSFFSIYLQRKYK